MTDKKKDNIVDFSNYLAEKDFEEILKKELADFSDEELDDLYDDLAFGQAFEEEWQEEEAKVSRENLQILKELEEKEAAGRDAWLASSPVGWINLRERPYLSNKMELALVYKQNGLYQKALDHLLEINQVEENDGLGTRYEIMAVYVLMSRHEDLEAFYFSNDYHQGDLMMDIPYMISNILAGKEDSVKDMLADWVDRVDGLFECCNRSGMSMGDIMEARSLAYYQANTMSAVYVSLSTFLAILIPSSHYIMATIKEMLGINEGPLIDDLDIFSSTQLMTLTSLGIRYISDIEDWSEAEFLGIPKIGPATIKKLKEKGVVFHP
ncbi:hypothetical protein [Streptococcus halotolerans]|uniref:hypothetical protein n=1 Tax=Streptococcus halotolerans TaxID=1814128 RepID=UPI0007885738|nr:hypothetical protein [Streptococcus halotolerans]